MYVKGMVYHDNEAVTNVVGPGDPWFDNDKSNRHTGNQYSSTNSSSRSNGGSDPTDGSSDDQGGADACDIHVSHPEPAGWIDFPVRRKVLGARYRCDNRNDQIVYMAHDI
ncbi:hypothetical protein E3N88_09619 [Mikania micrantha]|uniref:Uncharacterized protein n=1 Tax=Mikania micrantha TaxID=192012 RepID=A0A5N6PLU9_9ASTR|nr:hypothetical protein E3N88_09619 [Mikania micrantha]